MHSSSTRADVAGSAAGRDGVLSSGVSRVLVAAVGLPFVLGLVYLGGWWMTLLVLAIGTIALHEFYSMTRALRPLVLAGYVGLVLLGTAFLACGTAASAVTENQVVAAMLTYGVLVFSWFVSWNEAAVGETVAPLLLQLSLFDRFYGFAQGVIDSRDVVYLVALTTLFLFLAARALGTRTWRGVA